jgi:hypothetical protein
MSSKRREDDQIKHGFLSRREALKEGCDRSRRQGNTQQVAQAQQKVMCMQQAAGTTPGLGLF